MRASEYREKTHEELEQILHERTDDLLAFRMQVSTGVVENVRAARETRKDIARIRTIQNERKRATQSEPQGDNS